MNEKYEIKKTINNNISFSIDECGNEIIIIGKGISFGKKRGDFIEKKLVDKTFHFKNKEEKLQFDSLLSNISAEFIEVSSQIVRLFEHQLRIKLNPIIYITLSDHIANAVALHKEGIHVPNPLSNEIKRLYPFEYKLALQSLSIVKEQTDEILNDDEACFIIIHVINACGNSQNVNIKKKIAFIDSIINIIKKHFNIDNSSDNFYYQRFMTHMNYFSQMVLASNNIEEKDDSIYITLKSKLQHINACIDEIEAYIYKTYHLKISDEEKGYLMIHVNALTKKR